MKEAEKKSETRSPSHMLEIHQCTSSSLRSRALLCYCQFPKLKDQLTKS